MNTEPLKSDALLLLTATIWGFAFVAQRIGMDFVGPFAFNGIRFALGAAVLIPLILKKGRRRTASLKTDTLGGRTLIGGGILAGVAIFAGASFQQVGLVYTTAGKAGFITGLYVIIVPILGLLLRQKSNAGTWIGTFLAVGGLYLLSVTGRWTIAVGDFLEVVGAFFWAGHVWIVGWLSPKADSLKLAFLQFMACSVLSLIAAILFETITLSGLYQAVVPILYGGALSVGIAYTLQVVAQKKSHPAHAAIILSLESVFAAIGGWIILNETLTPRGIAGCVLMLAGMLISQLWGVVQKSG